LLLAEIEGVARAEQYANRIAETLDEGEKALLRQVVEYSAATFATV